MRPEFANDDGSGERHFERRTKGKEKREKGKGKRVERVKGKEVMR